MKNFKLITLFLVSISFFISCQEEDEIIVKDTASTVIDPCLDGVDGIPCSNEEPIDWDGGSGSSGSGGSGGSNNSEALSIDGVNFGTNSLSELNGAVPTPPNTNSDLMDLAIYYSPYIWFHPEESSYPSSIDWYLRNINITSTYDFLAKSPLNNIIYVPQGITPSPGSVNRYNLTSFNSKGEVWFKNAFSPGYTKVPWDINSNSSNKFRMEHKRYLRDGNPNDAKIYVYFKNSGSYLHIQYWVFYPFNGGGAGWHEGDWEHITVALNPDLSINAINFQEHGDSRWKKPDQISYVGSHPVAFSAKERHAFYNERGSHPLQPYVWDHTERGVWWRTENFLEHTGQYGQRDDWTYYTGEWGLDAWDLNILTFNVENTNPPDTPNFETVDDPNPFQVIN